MATPRRTQVTAPRIKELRLTGLEEADPQDIESNSQAESCRYIDADLSGRDLSGAGFIECEFLGMDAYETELRRVQFVDTRIERATAPSFNASRSIWRNATITDSRFGAVEMSEATVQSLKISGSKLSYVNFRGASLQDVLFENCVIDELDLGQARADRIAFKDCTVDSFIFDHAVLNNVDLRGLEIGRVSGVDAMSGTVITSMQAADLSETFAQHLRISVTG